MAHSRGWLDYDTLARAFEPQQPGRGAIPRLTA